MSWEDEENEPQSAVQLTRSMPLHELLDEDDIEDWDKEFDYGWDEDFAERSEEEIEEDEEYPDEVFPSPVLIELIESSESSDEPQLSENLD